MYASIVTYTELSLKVSMLLALLDTELS